MKHRRFRGIYIYMEDARGIYRYEETASIILQKCVLVSLGRSKDQTSWCSEKFGRHLMKFYLGK
jgi:hypothetical protein